MALRYFKLLSTGENLTNDKISKIYLKTAIEYGLDLRPPSKNASKTIDDFIHFSCGNEEELGTLVTDCIKK